MTGKKKVFVIIGSASRDSANQKLVERFAELTKNELALTFCDDLKTFPHFDTDLTVAGPPEKIKELRNNIEKADGILICTPEYVFSIPSGLKNILEWCVSTTVFSNKPTGLITASASGQKGHEELHLIMKTLMAEFTKETTLLIRGIKGKINEAGEITDPKTENELVKFSKAFTEFVIERAG
ncbi:MAG: NADPH-dependent FMN reductase [Bacteroidia bacterium]